MLATHFPRTPEGLGWFERRGRPQRIVRTNRHHFRHSASFVEAFGCTVHCHEAGLHEFAGGDADVRGFAFGDELAWACSQLGIARPAQFARATLWDRRRTQQTRGSSCPGV